MPVAVWSFFGADACHYVYMPSADGPLFWCSHYMDEVLGVHLHPAATAICHPAHAVDDCFLRIFRHHLQRCGVRW